MKYLVLNSDPRLVNYDFVSFLGQYDPKPEVHVVNCIELYVPVTQDTEKFASFVIIPTREMIPLMTHTLDRIMTEHKIDRIICVSEEDVLPGAMMREKYNLPGQKADNAILFRDKVKMKHHAKKHGIRVPDFHPIDAEGKWKEFAKKVRYPVIVKPVAGISSIGVRKAMNHEELLAMIAKIPEADLHKYEMEEFITGQLLHSNGFVVDGAPSVIWPSSYSTGCFEFSKGEAPLRDWLLEKSDKNFKPVVDMTEAIIKAFDLHNSTFHIEIFIDERSGEPIMLEAASRTGGDPIAYFWEAMLGLNLDSAAIMLHSGLNTEWLKDFARKFQTRKAPDRWLSYVNMPKQNGVLTKIGTNPPEGTKVLFNLKPHLIYQHWQSLGSFACNGLSEGATQAEALERIEAFENWYRRTHIWKSKSYYSLAIRAFNKFMRKLELAFESRDRSKPKLNVVFFGKNHYASTLAMKLLSKRHNISAIVHAVPDYEAAMPGFLTTIGKICGALIHTTMFGFARLHSIPYYRIHKGNRAGLIHFLENVEKDIGAVAIYPYLLGEDIQKIFPHGIYNMHPSLLPEYRGPQPEIWQYLRNDIKGGVTIHRIDKGEDTGPIAAQVSIFIDRAQSTFDYLKSCYEIGAEHMLLLFDKIAAGKRIDYIIQSDLPTPHRARNFKKDDVLIDWTNSTLEHILHSAKAVHTIFPLHQPVTGKARMFRWHPVSIRAKDAKSSVLPALTLDPATLPKLEVNGRVGVIDFGRGELVFESRRSLALMLKAFR